MSIILDISPSDEHVSYEDCNIGNKYFDSIMFVDLTNANSLHYNMRMIRNTPQEILLAKNLKPSPKRVKILSVCMATPTPLDVASVAKKIGDHAHLATVYRTLEKLVLAGILERIDFQEGKFRYEYVHDHHHHAICDSCQTIVEIQDQTFEKQISSLTISNGFNITRHAIEFFGLCGPCQKKGIYAS